MSTPKFLVVRQFPLLQIPVTQAGGSDNFIRQLLLRQTIQRRVNQNGKVSVRN